jgi:hypothetical protein
VKRLYAALLIALAAGLGCGGAGPPPEEEVTAAWTAGDDEPLSDESGDADEADEE